MKTILTILLTLISLIVFGQERYRIVYDYATDEMSYYLVDKNNRVIDTLKKPKIKRNSRIELQLKNVNPFAVSVSTAVNEENVHESGQSGLNFGSFLGQIGKLSGDQLKLNVPNTSLQNDAFARGLSRGGGVSSGFEEFAEVTTNVSTIRTTLLSNLSNPNLDKETILKNLEAAAKAYRDGRVADPEKNFYGYLTTLEQVVNADKSVLITEIEAMAAEAETQTQDGSLSRGERAGLDQLLRNVDNTVVSLETSATQTIDDINEIKAMYAALEASSFEQVYDYQLSADRMNIELNFSPTTFDGRGTSSGTSLKRRKVNLQSRGGFKINTGIAMTLNNFGRSSNDFFISEEGLVGSEKNDYFVPNLSTMINFYPMVSDNFNVGGSFGLSIPISDNIGGVNFLLGPSVFMGSKNRLSVSGGIAYGPVSRLTNGLRAGDMTELRSLHNFTKTVYDFGYFFGISFSLFDIN